MRRSRPLLLGVLALSVLSWAAPSAAQEETAGDSALGQIQDVARVKAEEGLALYAEARYAEAYERFRIAEDLFHAPTLVLYMAHCQRELGKLLEARALYERVAAETVAEDAPPAFREAPATAQASLDELSPRIPKLELVVVGAAAESAYVTLDGRRAALSPATVEVDPGTHRIDASATGARTVVMQVEVAEGGTQRVEIQLEPVASATPPAPPPVPPPARPPEPGPLAPALVAFGVGAAGLAVGGVAGAVVLGEVDRIRESCDGDRCPRSLEADRDDVRPLATVSTLGFVLGGAGVAAGVVLLVWRPGGTPGSSASIGRLSASVGPSSVTLRGAF